MAHFLRLGDSFQSLVRKTIANNDGDLYLQFDIAFTDPADFFYFDFAQFHDGVGFFGTTMFALSWTGTVWEDFEDSGQTSAVNPPSPLTWQTIKLRWRRGTAGSGYTDGITEVTVDGTLLWSDGDFYDEPTNQITFENDSGDVIYVDNIKLGTTPGGSEIFAEDFEGVDPLSNFNFVHNDATIVTGFDGPPIVAKIGPPTFEWRFAVAREENMRILAWLPKISNQQQVTFELNKPAIATGVVPSDSPLINLVQGDGFPIIDEGVRLLFGFRKESSTFPKWNCEYAGIILQVEDNVDENGGVAPYTTYTAYDPRQLLYTRPVRLASGAIPGQAGCTFTGMRGNEIVQALIQRTQDTDGETHIQLPIGGLNTDVISTITFQQGTSVGEALDQLVATGNCDIIFAPYYIPTFSTTQIAQVSVYPLAGYNFDGTPDIKYKAPLAWDLPRRNMVALNRLKDGVQRANRVQYFYGQSGNATGSESDFPSIGKYGEYWTEQNFPGSNLAAVELLAAEQVAIRKEGLKTFKVTPVPGSLGQVNSPIFALDYYLGTLLPMYASSRFREALRIAKRVTRIPITIQDNGSELISPLEFGEGEERLAPPDLRAVGGRTPAAAHLLDPRAPFI